MQQIHQMSQTIKKTEQLKNELNIQEQLRQQLLKQQEQEFNQQISQVSTFSFKKKNDFYLQILNFVCLCVSDFIYLIPKY